MRAGRWFDSGRVSRRGPVTGRAAAVFFPGRVHRVRFGRDILAAPVVVALLLAAMAAESAATRVRPAGADAYHAAAKRAVEAIPMRVGTFSAQKEDAPREAIALLKPNVIRCLKYADNDATRPHWQDRWASLLVDQCKDARDMNGHWPPNCYVNSGQEMVGEGRPRDWTVDGGPGVGPVTIAGTEYAFRQVTATSSTSTAVYNFLIVPGQPATLRDMPGLRKAAETYQQRFFGAAQFQLVMDGGLSRTDRDEIFTTLMAPCVPAIRTLMMTRPPRSDVRN